MCVQENTSRATLKSQIRACAPCSYMSVSLMVKRDAGPAILLTRSAVTTGVHLAVYGTLILIEAVLGAQF